MSDFAQAGLICTLQRLNDAHDARLDHELTGLAAKRPVTLILPCHGSELERPALKHICRELSGAEWLGEVFVSLNGLDAEGFERARVFFRDLRRPTRLLWNDGPVLQAIHAELLERPAADLPHGKGLNVWAAIGAAGSPATAGVLATQDCDVSSFRRATLARLCYACAHPELGFAFAKMYYSRVTDRLYGRVSRLFLAPLLQAATRVVGHQPLLDFLLSFRYPLAGEAALTRELAWSMPIASGWGLEIGMLCEVFRRVEPQRICQVDGGGGYDHKHQPANTALTAMCREIGRELYANLAMEGCDLGEGALAALAAAYRREGAQALRRSSALALINGLPFDRDAEGAIVDGFARAVEALKPAAGPVLPAWAQLARRKNAAVKELIRSAVPVDG